MRDAEIDRIDLKPSRRRKLHLQKRFERKRMVKEAILEDGDAEYYEYAGVARWSDARAHV